MGMPDKRCPYLYHSESATEEHVAFDLVDDRKRELGARTLIVPMAVIEGPVAEYCMFMNDLDPGLYYQVQVHVTRAGVPFGASPRRHTFESVEAAQRKAAELVAGARKRYAKRAAAGQKL